MRFFGVCVEKQMEKVAFFGKLFQRKVLKFLFFCVIIMIEVIYEYINFARGAEKMEKLSAYKARKKKEKLCSKSLTNVSTPVII